MKRSSNPTPGLDRLRRGLRPILAKRGAQTDLARVTGKARQQIHTWFIVGSGRPTAAATLLALGWYYEHPRRAKRHARHYAPTWEELTSTIRLALKMEDGTRKLAKYSGCTPSQVSRYFAAKPSIRRQPDGEFALVAWKWMHMLVKRDRPGQESRKKGADIYPRGWLEVHRAVNLYRDLARKRIYAREAAEQFTLITP